MARKKKQQETAAEPGEIKTNLQEVKNKIRRDAGEIINLKQKRAEINLQIAEKRAGIAALGVPKKSFDAALAYYELDEDQRAGLDIGYAIAREAFGLPVQADLFDDLDPKSPAEVLAEASSRPKASGDKPWQQNNPQGNDLPVDNSADQGISS